MRYYDEVSLIEEFQEKLDELIIGRTDRIELFQDINYEIKEYRKIFLMKFGYPRGLTEFLDCLEGAFIQSCRRMNKNRKEKCEEL